MQFCRRPSSKKNPQWSDPVFLHSKKTGEFSPSLQKFFRYCFFTLGFLPNNERHLRLQVSDDGVAHPLRDVAEPDGQPGYDVRQKVLARLVLGQPLSDGQAPLDQVQASAAQSAVLVLALVQRVHQDVV